MPTFLQLTSILIAIREYHIIKATSTVLLKNLASNKISSLMLVLFLVYYYVKCHKEMQGS